MYSLVAIAIVRMVQSWFVLDARVTDCYEGGPLTLVAKVTYNGPKKIMVRQPTLSFGDQFSILTPQTWLSPKSDISPRLSTSFLGAGSYFGGGGPCLEPGQSLTETLSVHNRFAIPRLGRATLVFRCDLNVYLRNDRSAPTIRVRLTKEIPVDVQPLDVACLRADTQAAIAREIPPAPKPAPYGDRERLMLLADRLTGTTHPELIPVMLTLLQHRLPEEYIRAKLWKGIWETRCDPFIVHQTYIRYLAAGNTAGLDSIFADWHTNHAKLGDVIRILMSVLSLERTLMNADIRHLREELRWLGYLLSDVQRRSERQLPARLFPALAAVDSFWVRAFTYAVFPEHLDAASRDRLFAEARKRVAPIPEAQLAEWLRDLDSPDFETRERATRRFRANIDRAGPFAAKALKKPASAEVGQRLESVLAYRKRSRSVPPAEAAFFRFAARFPTPSSLKILKVFAAGSDDSTLAATARKLLGQRGR